MLLFLSEKCENLLQCKIPFAYDDGEVSHTPCGRTTFRALIYTLVTGSGCPKIYELSGKRRTSSS